MSDLRTIRLSALGFELASPKDAVDWVFDAERSRAIEAAVRNLPSAQQQVIRMLYGIGEYPVRQAEIARELGLAPATVCKLRERGEKRLRLALRSLAE